MTDETKETRIGGSREPDLTPVEARVLGCLMEKQRATPDAYPLTLNALVQACNQKTSRNPLMRLEIGEVGHVVSQLRDRGLIHASFTGRAERYDHKMASNYRLSREEQALLCALMLRGPQTEGELRTNTGRMTEFESLQAVATILAGLAEREPPLVTRLPRPPGKREERFGHLLCGDVAQPESTAAPLVTYRDSRDEQIAALETRVEEMREELDALWELTDLADRRPDKR